MEDYIARARKRAAQRQTSSWYKLLQGDNLFRILPTPESKTTPAVFYEYRVHREVGPRKANVMCGKDVVNDEGRCWLCDVMIPKLRKMGKEVRAAALEPKDNLAIQVAKVDEDGSMSGPFIFTPSKRVGDQIVASILGSKKRKYADPKNGFNLTINRTGTGKNDTRYGMIEPDVDPSEVPSELVKKLKPFSELREIGFYDEAKQKAAYTGQDAVVEEEEEEEVKPKAKKATPKPEPEEDDEEEADDAEVEETEDEEEEEDDEEPEAGDEEEVEEDNEEEEEEPAPKKAAKGKPSKKQPEPEDDEELEVEEDDEEEEPAPKKVTGKGKKQPEPEPEEDDEVEVDEEEEDIDLDDIEEEEEEEPAPPPKKKAAAPVKGKPGKKK
jgi:hypothetical protein